MTSQKPRALDPNRVGDASSERDSGAFTVLGKPHRKVDAMERLTGIAKYTDDLVLPRMLHAKILRSPHAHAKILNINKARALAMPGVFAVIDGRDMDIAYGIIPWTRDEHALAPEKARYVGDAIAAVAAVDEETAQRALEVREVRDGQVVVVSPAPDAF